MAMDLADLDILDLVAVGGMAEIYRAHLTGGDGSVHVVAVKKLLPQCTADAELVQMFHDEARLGAQLRHPNIVQVLGLAGSGGDGTMVMEFADGRDLADLIHAATTQRRHLAPSVAVHVARETLKALGYAHAARSPDGAALRLVHRDVSPHNVMVGFDGWVKLMDFGVAKAAHGGHKTQAGLVKGKYGYMSPEQARGAPLDARSDLYNVGILLYEMITGQRLFDGATELETLERMRAARVPPLPRALRCPADLEGLLRRVLALLPQDRPPDARSLDLELAQVAARHRLLAGADDVAALMEEVFGASRWATEPAPAPRYRPDPDAADSTRMELPPESGGSALVARAALDEDAADPTRMEPEGTALLTRHAPDPDADESTRIEPPPEFGGGALVARAALDEDAADPTRMEPDFSAAEERDASTRMEPPPSPAGGAVRLPDRPRADVAVPVPRAPATDDAPPARRAARPPDPRHDPQHRRRISGLLDDDEPAAAPPSPAESAVFAAPSPGPPRAAPARRPPPAQDDEIPGPGATAMMPSPLDANVEVRVKQPPPKRPARPDFEWHEPSLVEESGGRLAAPPPRRPASPPPVRPQQPLPPPPGEPAGAPEDSLPPSDAKVGWLLRWPVWAAAAALFLAGGAMARLVATGGAGFLGGGAAAKGVVLCVRTSPPGAQVSVDGKPVPGTTPLTLPEPLPPGDHKVVATLGDASKEATVSFTERQRAANVVIAFHGDDVVEVKSRLAGALVYVDGQRVGLAPQRLAWLGRERPRNVRIVAGKHALLDELVRPDRPAHVTLEAGSDGSGGYPVVVLASPPAWVSMGGKDMGRTTGPQPFKLPAGRHAMTLKVPSLGLEREVFVEATGRGKKYFFDLYR